MDRQDLKDMLWFIAVAEERNFTRAAARLGTSQSTLSHTIKQLESRLGLRLLTRTTRSVSPTEAGESLLRSLTPRFKDIESDIDALMSLKDKPAGNIRINLPEHALMTVVWPKLRTVLVDYPGIQVELDADNGMRNIVEERFDAGVRLGESIDRDMIAVRISPDWRLIAVGSPSYFARHPRPFEPQDLVQHSCINHRHVTSGGLYAWEFEKEGRQLRVRVSGQLTFTASSTMLDAAVDGYGIAYVPEDVAREHLASGSLVQVLDDWCPHFTGYHLYYPSRRQNSAAFSVIVEALRYRPDRPSQPAESA